MKTVSRLFQGIRAKLLVLVLLPLALFAALSLVSIRALHKQQEEANLIALDRMPKTESILLTRVHSNALMRFLWTSAAITDPKVRHEKLNEVEERFTAFEKEVQHFASFKLSPTMREDFAPVLKDAELLKTPLFQAIGLLRKNDPESDKMASQVIFDKMVPQIYEITQAIEKCTHLLDEQVQEEIVLANKAADFGQNSVILLSLLGGLLLGAYGLYLANKLYASLNQISHAISETQGQVMTASGELATASHQASAGSTQAASALEETVASLEELTSMVKVNADHTQSASGLSRASIESALEGEKEMRALTEAMNEISVGSKKMSEIIEVIDGIAFQTNLLALNAAVEAARAGEQGRGFAVVAEAVRVLSQKSAVAAKDISQLIHDSGDKVDRGAKVADRSRVLLSNILESVKKVADINNEIAAASSEQAQGISQISQAMTELDLSVQQNAQASEEVAQLSDKMAEQSDVLHTSVQQLEVILQGEQAAPTEVAQANHHAGSTRKPAKLKLIKAG